MNLIKLEDLEPKFLELAQSHKAVVFAQECLFAKQLLNNNEFLSNTAMSNPVSLEAAILNIASIGLSLNPALKQAYLVPMDGKVNLVPSYMGLCHIAQETGSVRYVQAELVFENDVFEFQGVGIRPLHKFNPFSKDRGEIVGAYCIAKTSDDDYLTTMMPIDDIYSIRNRSKAYKAYLSKKVTCPWVTDNKAMILKTVVKSASKFWPKSERTYRLDQAVHVANESEGIDFEKEKQESVEQSAPPVNYDKKRAMVDEIKAMLTVITKEMNSQEKGALMVKVCKVQKFDHLLAKSEQELHEVQQELLTQMQSKNKPAEKIPDEAAKSKQENTMAGKGVGNIFFKI